MKESVRNVNNLNNGNSPVNNTPNYINNNSNNSSLSKTSENNQIANNTFSNNPNCTQPVTSSQDLISPRGSCNSSHSHSNGSDTNEACECNEYPSSSATATATALMLDPTPLIGKEISSNVVNSENNRKVKQDNYNSNNKKSCSMEITEPEKSVTKILLLEIRNIKK